MGSLGVFVAAVYYVLNIQNNRKNQEIAMKNQELMLEAQKQSTEAQRQTLETRQAQLLMQIYERYNHQEFWKEYMDIFQVKNEKELTSERLAIVGYFEGVGLLVEKGLIDVELVADLMFRPITSIWEHVSPFIQERRARWGDPILWIHYEHLYGVVKDYRKRKKASKE